MIDLDRLQSQIPNSEDELVAFRLSSTIHQLIEQANQTRTNYHRRPVHFHDSSSASSVQGLCQLLQGEGRPKGKQAGQVGFGGGERLFVKK